MQKLCTIPAMRFLAEDPRRRGSRQWDHGFFRCKDGERGSLVTWIEATGEVCALVGSGSEPEAFIPLGTAPSHRALEAVLDDRPDASASIVWVAQRLEEIPKEPDAIDALISGYEERLRIEAEETERAHLASFEVLELTELPDTDEEEAERWGGADWTKIAEIAVELSDAGVSARDQKSIEARGQVALDAKDVGLLWSLFYDPIAIPSEGTIFINGRHRTAAMRAVGVRRCVVHTDRGFTN